MPHKTDNQKMPRNKDARVKLTELEENDIRKMKAENPESSYKLIADTFGVNKMTVYYVINPHKRKEHSLNRDHWKKPDRKVASERVKNSRKKKRSILIPEKIRKYEKRESTSRVQEGGVSDS